jgi:trehalose 6-phosphate phosphatase
VSRHLLARTNVDVVAQLAWSRMLLALDYDGTLAPIVADRERAGMRPRTRVLLARAARLYPTAVISGRHGDDVGGRLRGLGVGTVVGNHGLDLIGAGARFADEMRAVRLALAPRLAGLAGVDLEDKQLSLAVHYRGAPDGEDALATILAAVARLPARIRPRAVPGKMVVDLVPRRGVHKGDAVVHARQAHGADTALYVGDDATDEDVFRLDQPGRLLGVRVGRSRESAAAYFLEGQDEIDDLLDLLGRLRTRSGRHAAT